MAGPLVSPPASLQRGQDFVCGPSPRCCCFRRLWLHATPVAPLPEAAGSRQRFCLDCQPAGVRGFNFICACFDPRGGACLAWLQTVCFRSPSILPTMSPCGHLAKLRLEAARYLPSRASKKKARPAAVSVFVATSERHMPILSPLSPSSAVF